MSMAAAVPNDLPLVWRSGGGTMKRKPAAGEDPCQYTIGPASMPASFTISIRLASGNPDGTERAVCCPAGLLRPDRAAAPGRPLPTC